MDVIDNIEVIYYDFFECDKYNLAPFWIPIRKGDKRPKEVHIRPTTVYYKNGVEYRENGLPTRVYHDRPLRRDPDAPAIIVSETDDNWYQSSNV